MKKVLFVVLDGIGDRPIKAFGNLTPLEFANTPNLDRIAENAICGQLYAIGPGIRPSSDVAHISLFGLDYKEYYTGRGPLELMGLGQQMQLGDIAWRGNFCSLEPDGTIRDRRAARVNPPANVLSELSRIQIESVTFSLLHIAEHRFALHAEGAKLSADISDSDPHFVGVKPYEIIPQKKTEESIFTARIVNEYIDKVNCRLRENISATSLGINGILLRSAGQKPCWPSFPKIYGFSSACCIANNALYNGVARNLGMKIYSYRHYKEYRDYYKELPNCVMEALGTNEFVFLHIQEGDLFGEDGDFFGKKNAIEEMDKALSFINQINLEETLVVVTADHSTPCSVAAHSGDSVPLVVLGDCVRKDRIVSFGERSCAEGALGTVLGKNLMQLVVNYCGKAELVGG